MKLKDCSVDFYSRHGVYGDRSCLTVEVQQKADAQGVFYLTVMRGGFRETEFSAEELVNLSIALREAADSLK